MAAKIEQKKNIYNKRKCKKFSTFNIKDKLCNECEELF